MEVFEDADVVVRKCQGVVGLCQEGVTPSGVLEVVDQASEDEGHGLDVLQMLPKVAHLYYATSACWQKASDLRDDAF